MSATPSLLSPPTPFPTCSASLLTHICAHTDYAQHPGGNRSSWSLSNADPTEYMSVPSVFPSRPAGAAPMRCTISCIHPHATCTSHSPTHTVTGLLPTLSWQPVSHSAPYMLRLYVRARVLCSCADSGFSLLTSLQIQSPWKQGGERGAGWGGHDVDFLTHSVPWDTNCQQLCVFVCACPRESVRLRARVLALD